MSQKKITDEQEPTSPNLDSVPKQEMFQVPSGYFESLPDAIMQRIAEEEQQIPRVIALQSRRLYWSAASVAACLLIGFCLYVLTRPESGSDISDSVAEAQDTSAQSTPHVHEQKPLVADKKEIVNYLMEHDVELSNITEAL